MGGSGLASKFPQSRAVNFTITITIAIRSIIIGIIIISKAVAKLLLYVSGGWVNGWVACRRVEVGHKVAFKWVRPQSGFATAHMPA